jgi:hypothetical protein
MPPIAAKTRRFGQKTPQVSRNVCQLWRSAQIAILRPVATMPMISNGYGVKRVNNAEPFSTASQKISLGAGPMTPAALTRIESARRFSIQLTGAAHCRLRAGPVGPS